MMVFRKHLSLTGRARTLLPALAFLGCATLSAAGGDTAAALCLLPAGLALEAARWHADDARKRA
jgi:hypothetical protein